MGGACESFLLWAPWPCVWGSHLDCQQHEGCWGWAVSPSNLRAAPAYRPPAKCVPVPWGVTVSVCVSLWPVSPRRADTGFPVSLIPKISDRRQELSCVVKMGPDGQSGHLRSAARGRAPSAREMMGGGEDSLFRVAWQDVCQLFQRPHPLGALGLKFLMETRDCSIKCPFKNSSFSVRLPSPTWRQWNAAF